MTNKTLSQQICEACGIEPKYRCSYHSCICPIQDVGKFNPKCPKQAVTKECDARSKEPRYPDFENKNFAKLFKMITTLEDFSFCTGFYYIPYIPSYRQLSRLSTPDGEYASESTDPIKAFLTCVFKCAVKEKDTANFIKQQQWEV